MKKLLCPSLILCGLLLTSQAVNAGIAYPDPPGGWTYLLNGDRADYGSGVAGTFDGLDGYWDFINGSSLWDGSTIGGTISSTNKPGGVMTNTEPDLTYPGTNVTYLRMQDCGNPSQYGFADPSNRKLMFGHDMSAEGCPDNVLDAGFTLTFRARVPTPAKTTAPLDNLYPSGESGNGPQPYPAGGDGYLINDNANGLIAVRQLLVGKLGFSLVVSNDTAAGINAPLKANFQGLMVNGLNGPTANNNVDFDDAALCQRQFLSLDPTEWNEFWIVMQQDLSGLGTHIALVYTNGALSPQIFHVTAASSMGEYTTVNLITLGMTQTAQSGTIDLDFLAYKFEAVFPPGAGGAPPTISAVLPTPPPSGNPFWPVASGISFTASSSGGKTIPTSGILLVLNGVNVSTNLIIGGTSTDRTVAYNGLVANTIYTGQITVTDSGGATATFPLRFDTFTEASSVVAEAEDYNHDSGQFKDNPAPGDYAGFAGTPEVDFHDDTPATPGAYRTADAVDTAVSGDSLRDKFGGGYDYDVGLVEQGEWMNYTRTFLAGKYNVYLRYASQVAQQVRLDLVTGDHTKTNQTTSFLGTFSTPSGTGYAYAQLSDAFGKPLVLNLSGVQTLRLTAPDASINLQLNYLVFAPASGAVANPPVVGFASPAPNSTSLLPDAPIQIGIVNRDTAVVTNTIKFLFDNNDVTSAATITPTAVGATIIYQPPSALVLNSSHTNRVVFGDNGTPAQSFTNQWSFKVANLPVLLAGWATPPGSGLTNGFNGKIHWHAAGQDLLFVNNATRGEDQVGDLLNDAGTGLPYVNDAAGDNGDGTFSVPAAPEIPPVINYSGDGTDQGLFSGDLAFPYILPTLQPDHIAMAVTANLELSAGLHRFGVRRNAGFKLSAGPDFSRAGATLPLGVFESSNNDPGLATTEFDFMVAANGVYPIRLIYFENSGVCSVEWYSVNRTTGVATLINDSADPAAVKAYMSRLVPPTITKVHLESGNFVFSYPTVVSRKYYVDYKNSLGDAWTLQPEPGITGDGTEKSSSAPFGALAARFYRVRVQ